MSGIVGIFHLDRAPVDQGLLRRMTDFMTFRGPDAQNIWVGGDVGFGHTLLKTTFEAENELQPFTLDGRVHIVADARVDAQGDLILKLEARGHEIAPGTTDVELILRAYQVWGEDCVEHLLGDFAFAVWDEPKERLFCARDHMGVKPFYYAQLGQAVIFSNTLDCIRQHPAVSDTLNDLAIADFLLFDLNQDPATTSFSDIRRLPPAHRAAWSRSGLKMSRYWRLLIDEPLYLKRPNDYTDRFKELLSVAVGDRLRTNRVGVWMSGGLDSPTLAATACEVLRARSADSEVRAFTTVWDGFDKNERYFAGLVADKLGIPIHYRELTGSEFDPYWDQSSFHTPEPAANPTRLAAERRYNEFLSSSTRVFFEGEGPDNALHYEWRAHIAYLSRRRRWVRLLRDVGSHVVRHRRVPLLPTVPRMLKERFDGPDWTQRYPGWIEKSLETRLHLRERWEQNERNSAEGSPNTTRPVARQSFGSVLWEEMFRGFDAGETMVPLEVRHPFVDLRLLRYLLALPVMPWCRSKYIVRRAMKGVLPDLVLRRRKTPVMIDSMWKWSRSSGLPPLKATIGFDNYVNPRLVAQSAADDMVLFRTEFRPYALNYWLQNLYQSRHTEKEGRPNELVKR